jgi:hypothetical protein
MVLNYGLIAANLIEGALLGINVSNMAESHVAENQKAVEAENQPPKGTLSAEMLSGGRIFRDLDGRVNVDPCSLAAATAASRRPFTVQRPKLNRSVQIFRYAAKVSRSR